MGVEESRGLPLALRNLVNEVLFGAAAKLCHVGLRPGLVEEDQTSGIDEGLTGAPARAVAAYVWPIPLRAMRVFLNVTPGSSIGVPDLLDPQRSKNAEAANSHFPVRIPMPSGQVSLPRRRSLHFPKAASRQPQTGGSYSRRLCLLRKPD
jgi:hypothetical protein